MAGQSELIDFDGVLVFLFLGDVDLGCPGDGLLLGVQWLLFVGAEP